MPAACALTSRGPLPSGTAYAAIWLDQYDSDYGCYCVFSSRGKALDYLVDTVFERAETLGVDVTDPDDMHRRLTRDEVRDILGGGDEFRLVLSYDCLDEPEEWVSMKVVETEVRR